MVNTGSVGATGASITGPAGAQVRTGPAGSAGDAGGAKGSTGATGNPAGFRYKIGGDPGTSSGRLNDTSTATVQTMTFSVTSDILVKIFLITLVQLRQHKKIEFSCRS